jgi:predicted GNAT family N-acyltransferase
MSKINIKIVNFNTSYSEIEKIRTTVFIEEQKVPTELEWDEFDQNSLHILAYYDNKAVGTARLLTDGHIGRMAVLKEYRNRNIGESMLKYLLEIAQEKAYKNIKLSAQEHAVDFYKKYGFSVSGDIYMDAGIPHFDMEFCKNNGLSQ